MGWHEPGNDMGEAKGGFYQHKPYHIASSQAQSLDSGFLQLLELREP